MNISLVQPDIVWENPDENRRIYTNTLQDLKTELVILPELFTTGFTMNAAAHAETMKGKTIEWMQSLAEKMDIVIGGSLIISENNSFYNRFVFVGKHGLLGTYDKRHLFRMGEEHRIYAPGTDSLTINYKGWRIRPLICYDIRFPVWSRNRNDYDLLIYTANWPSARQKVWEVLLQARAMENQVYVAGVNRVGFDGNNINHTGGSVWIDPKGEIRARASEKVEVLQGNASKNELKAFRKKFPAHLDADPFTLD